MVKDYKWRLSWDRTGWDGIEMGWDEIGRDKMWCNVIGLEFDMEMGMGHVDWDGDWHEVIGRGMGIG